MKFIYLFVLLSLSLFAQYEKPFVEKYGVSTFGKEFIFSVPSMLFNFTTTADIILYSEYNCSVKVSGITQDYNISLKAYEKKIVTIPIADVVSKVISLQTTLANNSEVFEKKAVEITSNYPVQCFIRVSDGSVSEATQIYPNNVLGKDYILQSYMSKSNNQSNLSPIFTISAIEDSTELNITLGGLNSSEIKLNNVSYNFGNEFEIKLNKKDVLQILNFQNSESELSGTRVNSNKKINVISGHFCADVPNGVFACNPLLESNLPTHSFGKKNYIPKLNNRMYGGLIRVFAVEKNTKIYEDGELLFTLSNSKPGLKGNSWDEFRVNEKSSSKKYSIITSDKPIGVSFLNTGENEDNSGYKPFLTHLIPVDFYSKYTKIIFPTKIDNNEDSNYVKLILPAKNQRIDNEVYFRNSNSNEWFRLNEYYNDFEIYDNDNVILNDFDVNQEVEIWSEKGLFPFIYNKTSQNFPQFGTSIVNSFWDLSKKDTTAPEIEISSQEKIDSNLTVNIEIKDAKSDLIRYILQKESGSNTEFIQNIDLISESSNTYTSTFTIIPKENILYNIYAIDNANNYTKYELGDMYVKEEEKIEYDSLDFNVEYLDFGLVQLNDSSIFDLEITSISSTTTQITEISIDSDDDAFEILEYPTLPLSINVNEKFKLKIKYSPIKEYTENEENIKYGKVDFDELIIESSNTISKLDIIGKGGVARINAIYNNNNIIDTLSFGKVHLVGNNRFFIENFNIATKENGTYPLTITGLNLDSLYDLTWTKVHADNINFKGKFELDENDNFKTPIIFEPGERIYFNEEVEFLGTRDGIFYYNIPIISNAVNSKNLGFILFEFIVFEEKFSNVKLGSDDYKIQNKHLTINIENFKTHSEFAIFDINGKKIIERTKITSMNTIDLSQYNKEILFLVIIENDIVKFAKILIN